ncbi:sorbitol dehydrogenase family protein [Actibacterium sp. 188UL27-1]|uniref:sorbitol dehydrogenase family protein n=1 Tax=Actibacterium sp. 188UL27-1 TaxID=2786961 RepID=UPI001EF72B85|nr:sorbitol dehydrogenase family protein [Actibacterium sp. 188UL27-1]
MKHRFSRRGFLATVSGAALATASNWPGDVYAQNVAPDAFLKLSEAMTGAGGLSDDIASDMLSAFEAAGKGSDIAALLDGEADRPLENEIVAAWYSGVSPNPDDDTVLTYTDALMWSAMTYTKPLGFCGGGMGYWTEPPTA